MVLLYLNHSLSAGEDSIPPRPRGEQLRRLLQAKRRHRGSTSNEKWVKLHEQLAREVNAADEDKGLDVLFYGDSIFESTR